MCFLAITMLFIPKENMSPPFKAKQSIEKVSLKNMIESDFEFNLIKNRLRISKGQKTTIKEYYEEIDRIKQEEIEKEKVRLQEQQKEESKWINFELTFYSDLDCENGFGNTTCESKTLINGMVANNFYDLGTTIHLENYGDVIVSDRGSKKYFNNYFRLDVFVARINSNEDDDVYLKRVNNMGKKYIKGYIIK